MSTGAAPAGASRSEGMFGFTRLSQLVALVLLLSYGLVWWKEDYAEYLYLVVGRVFPNVWTLLTAGFLETNAVSLVISVVGVLFTAKVLEPAWGSKEFLKYVLLVNVASAMCLFVATLGVYLAMQNPAILYEQINGFYGILGGLLVGVKQVLPDKEARLFRVVRIPSKYLPSLYVLGSAAVAVALHRLLAVGALVAISVYVGWLYLRFFQPKSDGRGDGTPDFRFATFFPPLVHPYVDAFAAACSRLSRLYPDTRGAAPSGSAAAPGSAAPMLPAKPIAVTTSSKVDANRRRERGARVLEERLGLKPGLTPSTKAVPAPGTAPATAGDVEQGGDGGADAQSDANAS